MQPSGRRAGVVVIGVLGGIASGKSLAARSLAGEHGLVIDADALAREELDSPQVRELVRTELGPEYLDGRGRVDRTRLARLVFTDPQARRKLESWIHPRVRGKIWARLAEARAAGRGPVVLDVPLLLENDREHGLAAACDFLVFVAADQALRDRRAVESRGWQPGEVARREATQMPLAEKQARAHHVIHNESGLEELAAAVAEVRRIESLDRP